MAKEITFKNKIVLGLTENITIISPDGTRTKIHARIDTGATKSSIDEQLAKDLKLGPILRTKAVRQSQGRSVRGIIEVSTILCRKKIVGDFTVADRSHMKYKILVGQNLLEKGFLIDPNKIWKI